MYHENYNVFDLEKSLEFYDKALGLKEIKRIEAEDGSIIEYTDWRDYKTYEQNVDRKSAELSKEEEDREKEYISSLKHMLEVHEDNLKKIVQRREQHLANKKNKKWKKSK